MPHKKSIPSELAEKLPDERQETPDIVDPEQTDMPMLTHKQQGFVNDMLKGHTTKQAYLNNYNVRTKDQAAIAVNAAKARQHPDVQKWLAALWRAGMQSQKDSLMDYLNDIKADIEEARNDRSHGAIASLRKLQGQALQLLTEKHVHHHQTDTRQELIKLKEYWPELANTYAKQLGYDDVIDAEYQEH